MSFSKTLSEIASQDVSAAEFDVLDGGITTLGAVTVGSLGSDVTGAGLYESIAIICDQKLKTEHGGTFNANAQDATNDAWRTRDLNTHITPSSGSIVTALASNQFTLAAGTYHIEWIAPANGVDSHTSRLYNITDTSEVQVSQTGAAVAAVIDVNQNSMGMCVFTIAGSKVFEIQHRCQTTQATNGFGLYAYLIYLSSTAPVSIYTMVTIRKHR